VGNERTARDEGAKVYLVGGGIASLAAAAFLIRDADIPGRNITILEQCERLGGSLDGGGSPQEGYVIRGERILENKYVCTYDLFSSIPSLSGGKTVTQEIFGWNQVIRHSSKSRLVRDGHRIDAPEYGLTEKQILTLERLAAEPEEMLGASSLSDQFDPSFFETNFWIMWSTTFSFQPWHSAAEFKRYLRRFAHIIVGFNRLHGVMHTVYEKSDSMIRPLLKWLGEHGVQFELNTRVTDLAFHEEAAAKTVERMLYARDGISGEIAIGRDDYVIVTLGSMAEASSLGSMDSAPALNGKSSGGAWAFWEKIASGRPEFGRPSVFADHIDQSKWVSFTTSLRDSPFFRIAREVTGNVPGVGGLITFADSTWLASILLPHQPHFLGQPRDVDVFWGYGLFADRPGNFVKKPMSACTGREIMSEILGHLQSEPDTQGILKRSICIPCMMPFITSQFLPREKGDRPQVVPPGWKNLAFTGQFCELPDDVVFTLEYSIRSAQTAVYSLFRLKREPPAIYKEPYDSGILRRAFRTSGDLHEVSGLSGQPIESTT
jgi:oleate hydratase